jgi:glutamine transport system ATP-binding protein
MNFALNVGTRLLFMDEGRIIHDGNPKELYENPPSDRLRDFLRHIH